MQKWTTKMKSTQKTGQGAPTLQKVNSRKKSTVKPAVKVNGQSQPRSDDISKTMWMQDDITYDVSRLLEARGCMGA